MGFVSNFFLLMTSTALAGPWGGGPAAGKSPSTAAYFLNNDPSGNSIVSLRIGKDGSLSYPIRTSTNGHGSIEIDSTTGKPFTADPLGSQGSVHVAHNMLFAVNAGSNTLSMFTIDPQDPCRPKLVGSPADTLGDFPVSVDYSSKLRKACVLNGGTKAGVTCFSVDVNRGLEADGPLRALPRSIINQTTPPSGTGAASQVLFNPDSTAVFAAIQGDPGAHPVKLGSLAVWPVEAKGAVSTSAPIVSQIGGLVIDFGFQFLSQSRIFMVDPSFGTALLDIGSNYKATQAVHTVLPGQVAVCWTQYEPRLETLYAIDAGQNLFYTLDAKTGAVTGNITAKLPHGAHGARGAGLLDSAIKDGKMYSLAVSGGVYVIDLAQKRTQQYLDLSAIGSGQFFQGMAVWP